MRRDTDMCRSAEKRSSPSGTMHGGHVRNVHAFPRTHRRIAELYICIYICMYVTACVYTHTHIHVSRAMAMLSRVRSRPSIGRQAVRTCQRVIIRPVLLFCPPWHSVKMTVSADAQGCITRPIHATLITTGIVIESRASRRIQSVVVAAFKAHFGCAIIFMTFRSRDSERRELKKKKKTQNCSWCFIDHDFVLLGSSIAMDLLIVSHA